VQEVFFIAQVVTFIGLVLTQHTGKVMDTGKLGSLPSAVGSSPGWGWARDPKAEAEASLPYRNK